MEEPLVEIQLVIKSPMVNPSCEIDPEGFKRALKPIKVRVDAGKETKCHQYFSSSE